jgi:very-short-patch-repair endonuclease
MEHTGRIRYDWTLVQLDHNAGMSWTDIRKKYGVTHNSIAKAQKRGDFVSRNKSEAGKIYVRSPLSEEHKKNISIARTKYLKENPDKVPYKLNHYSKGQSYPESYFENWLKDNQISYTAENPISIYRVDFLIGNIALEIDGEQHYLDERIVKSNFYRDEYLKSIGIQTIRIRWSHYQKFSDQEKQSYLFNLRDKLSNIR